MVPVVRTSTIFVEPGRPMGTPAVMTASSPSCRSPALTQLLIASLAATLTSDISNRRTGCTPHHRASSRHVCWDGVTPRMGQEGLCLLIIRAVIPLRLRQMMAGALICFAMRTAAPLTASGTLGTSDGMVWSRLWMPQMPSSFSARSTMCRMVATDWMG